MGGDLNGNEITMQIRLDREKLKAYNLAVIDVLQTLEESSQELPACQTSWRLPLYKATDCLSEGWRVENRAVFVKDGKKEGVCYCTACGYRNPTGD